MNNGCCDDKFSSIEPAKTLTDIWDVFEPTLVVDPRSEFYINRTDPKLQKLSFDLKKTKNDLHAFLCGHRGSGKTTELNRLCHDPEIQARYETVFLTAQDFGTEVVQLTHDALLVEIGLALAKTGQVSDDLAEQLNAWGREVVTSFLHGEEMKAQAGAKGNAWLAFFRAELGSRREWKREEKLKLDPRIQDLVDIINRMGQQVKNATKKKLLLIIDDLEKGESEADKEMHKRLFQENYDTLVQPRFSIIYTLPVYFRGLSSSRIPSDELYAFSAVRLYEREHKTQVLPPLSTAHPGYVLMRSFVEKRLTNPADTFEEGVLDELLRIGGGLFRETARAIREAAYFAIQRDASCIGLEDARKVFDQVKKEYQPLIRGTAIALLKEVQSTAQGWVDGVEPFLQSRAVVEYENGDLWLDLRHVLKEYVLGLPTPAPTQASS